MPDTLPPFIDIERACRAHGLGMGAAELHGSLAGWLAGGGSADARWLARVSADDAVPDVPADGPLAEMAAATAGQFEDRDFGLVLLLPEGDAGLGARSGALFDWCRGFVGAFGLASGAAPRLSEEGTEALADLARLAGATAQDEGDEDDEAALAEIEEFVRVAALLLHGDCAMAARHRQRLN
jgi:uncharacterized protein YgfB (UPF0149 family)